MSYRKILYGYQIQNGELTLVPEEAAVVNRIAATTILMRLQRRWQTTSENEE